MSSSASKQRVPKVATPDKAFGRLERAVVAALEHIQRIEGELARLQAQAVALEELLKGVTSGERGPREMVDTLRILEEENRDLRKRLSEGLAGVDRLLARVKFLEEQ